VELERTIPITVSLVLKRLVAVVLPLLVSLSCVAQPYGDPAYKQGFAKAHSLITSGSFVEAKRLVDGLHASDSSIANLNYMLGVCFLEGYDNYDRAIHYLEIAARSIAKDYSAGSWKEKRAPGITYFHLGRAYHLAGDYEKAVGNYYNYRSFIGVNDVATYNRVRMFIKHAEHAMELVKNPVKVDIVHLGQNVNSGHPDYAPIITPDGSRLIFTSRRPGGLSEEKDSDGNFPGDIYVSKRASDGSWGKALLMPSAVNTKGNDAAIGLSNDGRTLYLLKEEDGGANIHFSDLKGSEWGSPQKLGGDVNSAGRETYISISPKDDMMVFTSDRTGGYGGRDLWYCLRLPDGNWGLAQNMGSVINTPFEEESPFLAFDGRTVFFSSQGHTSMGGFDIFSSEYVDSAWTEPKNLGFPLNSAEDDMYLVMAADGETAYFSSARSGGFGDSDIYTVRIVRDLGYPMAVLKGEMVIPSNDFKNLRPRIVAKDGKGKQFGEYRPNPNTGRYILLLTPGADYSLTYHVEGFDPVVRKVSVKPGTAFGQTLGVTDLDRIVFGEDLMAVQEAERIAEEERQGQIAVEKERAEEAARIRERMEALEKQREAEAEARKAEELLAKQEAEEKRKAEEERKAAELLAKQQEVEQARSEEEKRKADEAARAKAEEERKAVELLAKQQEEEQARSEEEKRKADEAARAKAEEERKAAELFAKQQEEEQARSEEERRKADEAARAKAEEERKAAELLAKQREEEQARSEEEKRKADEAARAKAEEERKVAELLAKQQEEEQARLDEAVASVASVDSDPDAKKREELQKRLLELRQKKQEMAQQIVTEVAAVQEAGENIGGPAKSREEVMDSEVGEDETVLKEDLRSKALEEAKRAAEQIERQEEEQRRAEEEARIREEESRKAAEMLAAEEEVRLKMEREAKEEEKRRAAEEARAVKEAEEARLKAETEAREAEARAKKEDERLAKEAEAARVKAEKEAKEAEMRAKREEEARIKAEKEAREAEERAQKAAEERKRLEEERQLAAKYPLLRKGSRGEKVKELQKAFGLDADGIFGSGTERTVIRFQEKSGLKADGVVGRVTWQALELALEADNIAELLAQPVETPASAEADRRLAAENAELRRRLEDVNAKLESIMVTLSELQAELGAEGSLDEQTADALREGKTLILQNILFDYNKARLRGSSERELDKLARFMRDNTDISITVSGHTDAKGDEDYNLRLSRARAEAVVKYLISKGVPSGRLDFVGFGDTRPVARNVTAGGEDNPLGRQLNRRIEISVKGAGADLIKMEEVEIPESLRLKGQ
jgi:outer membrane protein OmpA-like peptidoglycan-associated protein